MTRSTPAPAVFSRLRERRLFAGMAVACSLALAAAPTHAQTVPGAPQASDKLAVNLVRLLVKQGVISQSAADTLIAQAEAETAQAQIAAAAQTPVATASAAPAAAAIAQGPALPAPAPGAQRVYYVPQIVRDQIRDEVKAEVIAKAKTDGWISPGRLPDWVNRLTISGDMRARDQSNLYDRSNVGPSLADPSGGAVDFASFNANGPTDINPQTNLAGVPILNTRKDRDNLLSIRARLALDFAPSEFVRAGLRIATGDSNGPVSTTQLLGGGFSKKDLWLDRAFITLKPGSWGQVTFGRMPNPFLTTELVFDEDLNFDGVSGAVKSDILSDYGVKLGFTGGAFPVDYQAQNFPTNDTFKRGEATKWLFGGQGTAEWTSSSGWDVIAAAAYYAYTGTRGRLSEPCAVYAGVAQCSTDFTRAPFLQKGNTLFFIRDLVADPTKAAGATALPQFAGLVFDYDILDLNLKVEAPIGDYKLVVAGDYARNLGYDAGQLCTRAPAGPITNVIAGGQATNPCVKAGTGDVQPRLASGADAFGVRATFGMPTIAKLGDWSLSGGYRYIEADAVLDAFNDNDFHLGGTNAKGYFVAGTLGVFANTSLQARFFSSREIDGPRLLIDVGQLDLNVKF